MVGVGGGGWSIGVSSVARLVVTVGLASEGQGGRDGSAGDNKPPVASFLLVGLDDWEFVLELKGAVGEAGGRPWVFLITDVVCWEKLTPGFALQGPSWASRPKQ